MNQTTKLLLDFTLRWSQFVTLNSVNNMKFDDLSIEVSLIDAQDKSGKYLPPDFVLAYVGLCRQLLEIPASERVFLPQSVPGDPAKKKKIKKQK